MLDFTIIKKVFLVIYLIRTTFSIALQNNLKHNENSQLEVRAVMIKCKIRETANGVIETDITRFQREELFKHNALRDCKQKITLTVKACSEPGEDSGDEYIPIEHVLGPNRKRIRLLHPYVLRLQRQVPFQVYKLRRIDTVTGFIGVPSDKFAFNNSSKRLQRDTKSIIFGDQSAFGSGNTLDYLNNKRSFSIKVREPKKSSKAKPKVKTSTNFISTCDNTNIWHQGNESLLNKEIRVKRKIKKYEKEYPNKRNPNENIDVYLEKDINFDDEYEHFNPDNLNDKKLLRKTIPVKNIKKAGGLNERRSGYFASKLGQVAETVAKGDTLKKENFEKSRAVEVEEKNFALFDIGNPDVYYNAQIQLFEKLNTPEGKTVWNDLTRDEIARVSSVHPEWSDKDIYVKYKPLNWLAREDFTLPNKRLCLVVPLKVDTDNPIFDKHGDFIIVPHDDIITVNEEKEENKANKRDKKLDNLTDTITEEGTVKRYRRVMVRVARALMGGSAARLKIISREGDHFLKLPHKRRHHAQIDIEGRTDNNELVLVGALGRLTTIVSDTTRKSRSIITVQATNTGLAAARFRVKTRECTPELSNVERSENDYAGPTLVPPWHSGIFRLEIPIENAIQTANCVVSMVNQDDESVAIRNVRIINNDRCFCVWHCDCVCLSEDPKLLCRGLTEAQMAAAGLFIKDRTRHARSVCYPDVMTINIFVTFIGVLLALLLLGVTKAFLGLILNCVGNSGLHLLFQKPRKLNHYYEDHLRSREVIYDSDGWPVHPDSKQRTVRLVSIPMEFILNSIFFIIIPFIIIWGGIREPVLKLFTSKEKMPANCCRRGDAKKCFSSHDVQGARRRCRRRPDVLQRWMTPQAENLSAVIWKEELTPSRSTPSDTPLLHENNRCFKNDDPSICSDSDQEDTEYVLMQMQKSRESLAKCQQNHEEGQTPSQWIKKDLNANKK